MGMIIELYSLDPQIVASEETTQPEAESIRRIGTLVGSVSINSVAVGETFQWMLQSPLAQLVDIQAVGSTTMLVQTPDITALVEQMNKAALPTAAAVTNAMSDAADEVLWREQILGIVMS
jgi:hypothetical protein